MSTPTAPHQPALDGLVTVLDAPLCAVSADTGDLGGHPIHGVYAEDRRVLSRFELEVADARPERVSATYASPCTAEFVSLLRGTDGSSAVTAGLDLDARARLHRSRHVDGHGLTERITLHRSGPGPVRATLVIRLACDGASVSTARTGHRPPSRRPRLGDGTVTWSLPDRTSRVVLVPRPDRLEADPTTHEVVATWQLDLDGDHPTRSVTVDVAAGGPDRTGTLRQGRFEVVTPDRDLDRLVRRSLADASALVRRDADDPRDRYLCAGSPWYLTLFGRDSLWAAHMLLPVDREIALGTLRALARRQGTQDDPTTGEQPGKILHELRDPEVAEFLPPRYYGTVDATSLWVVLLVDTWRWGAAREEIAPLVPHLEAALAWIAQRASEDGYLRYTPDPDGLANQGWKDSTDAIHLADGTLLPGSVALAEAQGYAYRAAAGAADLLEALGQGDPSRWRRWAAGLAVRFGTDFWVRTGAGRHPALALGPDGTRASAAASNMGHLLGTGILTPQDAAHVAAVLGSPALDSGFGLRTLTSESPRYDPLSYHNGSVWPHDTAIAVAGLVAEGHGEVAGPLARGILDAAASFDHRLPELWGGGPAAGAAGGSSPRPLPYPTACSPQAWAATTAISLITSALGLQVDVPAGRLVLAPPRPALLGPLGVRGLRVGTGELDVDLTADGGVTVLRAPEGLSVEVRRG